jgi:hypothetical protein
MADPHQPQPFNGVNAITGEYGLQWSADDLVQRVFGDGVGGMLRRRQQEFAQAAKETKIETFRGVREGVDGTDLSQSGWGVIFAYADPNWEAIQEALQPLFALRQAQAAPYFRIFTGPDAYRPGETKPDFLRRFNIGSGAVDPKRGVPYYLLLIGSPELIPFDFQYQLDVQFAVGRLDFDSPAQYATYANGVLAAELGQRQPLARTAAFFSVTNPDDSATASTDKYLVQPLAAHLAATPDWQITTHRGADATRSRLESLLGGEQKPALLFTASHGIEFPAGDPLQERRQGALLCNEWPGPRSPRGPLPESYYFAGDHLSDSADPRGLIAFHFACYGGGTPQFYDFEQPAGNSLSTGQARQPLANRPFVANLPKRLLGHPRGGALAVVSHVDRAWSYSYRQGETPQTAVFEDTLTRLFAGQPLGWALEYFNTRYAELAADLSNAVNRMSWGSQLEPYQIASLWTENHDARNYIVLGDPAVRLAVAPLAGVEAERQPIPILITPDGRPLEVSVADWAQTPQSVKVVLARSLDSVRRLTAQVEQTPASPAVRRPVYRDGGRSSGILPPSATTRGGAMRGGALRGGGTRSGQPSDADVDESAG